jgi:hypothetical protein
LKSLVEIKHEIIPQKVVGKFQFPAILIINITYFAPIHTYMGFPSYPINHSTYFVEIPLTDFD